MNYSYLENMDRPMHTNSPVCVHFMNLLADHINYTDDDLFIISNLIHKFLVRLRKLH